MTKSAVAPKEPLALVPMQAVSHALEGTIEDKLKAYDQIAANMAQLGINGWDTAQKCKAACWLADGKREHPAVFIENHYVMQIKGRLTIEPKWEYMVRKMKENVPGFRYKILIETDDACKVEATDGTDTHVVEYTLNDARRQGLLGRDGGNMWTTGSTREGCFKQAMKRALRRLGVGRAMPWVEMDMSDPTDAPAPAGQQAERAIGEAVVVDDGVPWSPAVEAGAGAEGAAPSPTPAAPPVDAAKKSPVLKLSTVLVKMYGKQPVAVALEKASLLYNEAMKAKTGQAHSWTFQTAKEITPEKALVILDYLETRDAAGAREANGGKVAAPSALALEDEPPPSETEEPPPAEAPADLGGDLNSAYDDFMVIVKRAKGLFGRKFVTEAPVGSGKMWFIDETTFRQTGKTASVKLSDNGEVVVSHQDLVALSRILATDCDKQERGGR